MLAHRVIPILLHRGHQLVKGKRFDSWRSVGHALQAARVHNQRGVDELVMLDIGATPEGRGPDLAMVEALANDCFMPLTVGGGVRSTKHVRQLLDAGADKIAICTGVCEVPELIEECSAFYGCQAIVVAVDVGYGNTTMIRGGKQHWSHHPDQYAQFAERHGAGEILLTSIDREGTMEGYDLELIRAVSEAVDIPVIANGGCSGPEDMVNAIKAGASACAAGALFQFTDHTPRDCSRYLQENGIEARV